METIGLGEREIINLLKSEIESGKSLTALARELGVDPGTLSRIVNGKRALGKVVLRALAERYPDLKTDLALFLLG